MRARLPTQTEIITEERVQVNGVRSVGLRVDRNRRTILITYEYQIDGDVTGSAQIALKGKDWKRFWKVATAGKQLGQELDRVLLAVAKQKNIVPTEAIIDEEDYDEQDVLPPPPEGS